MTLQAFPEDWPLIERVRSGQEGYEALSHAIYLLGWRRDLMWKKPPKNMLLGYSDAEEDYKRVAEETVELIETAPDFVWRHADLCRSYKFLHPLLIDFASTSEAHAPVAHAIYGSDNITDGESDPVAWDDEAADFVRWNDAASTRRIEKVLKDVEYADLIALFLERKEQEDSRYELLDLDRANWEQTSFNAMKELYRLAAESGIAIIKDQTY